MPDSEELARYQELREVVARLRAADGCPWDREQTHESLKPYLLQEAYEVLAVLDDGDTARLPEEMGDLLLQVLIHTQIAEEAGEFRMSEVFAGLVAKLVRRHPHVFGDTRLATADEVMAQWDRLKSEERPPRTSALDGVPIALPALAAAQELLRRAAAAGFEWPDARDVLSKLGEEVEELAAAEDAQQRTEEFGDILINLANYARYQGIDAEAALRLAVSKFRTRFQTVEQLAAGRPLSDHPFEELLALWAQAKGTEPRA